MDLASLLLTILNVFTIVLVARALYSWVDPGMTSPIGKFLRDVTEPIVAPIRQVIPPMGMLDLSIMVTMLLLIVLRQLVASTLT